MIYFAHGTWSITCGGCLATLPDVTGTRADVVALITAAPHFWEMQNGDMCRCVACARTAREVPFPLTRRGMRGTKRW